MTTSDAVGSSFVIAFGLWWILLPNSVIRFYTWFHRGELKLPAVRGVRLAGAIWLIVVVAVIWRTVAR